jgi:RNA polymerase sigma-70 factor (ECF subfamily)
MAHLKAGHGDALAVLFDRYQRLIFKVALKILRDAGEAEDVMQSVFLEIMRVATQFDPQRGSTKVWLLQYAYHRSMNRRQLLIVRHFYDNADISDLQEVLAAPGHSGPASIETTETVKRALSHLNPVQRRVLHLAYFEGLSLKEIAASTGESFGNVRNHYYRGLSKLRLMIAENERAQGSIVRGETADAGA